MLLRAVCCVLILLATASGAAAAPVLFASPTGVNAGVVEIPVGSSLDLGLWLDPGQPYYDYSLTLVADSGLDLVSFTPNALEDILFNLDGNTLSLTGGTTETRNELLFIGTLATHAASIGGTLVLDAVPPLPDPALVDASLELVPFDVPATIATVVPEPSLAWLVSLGALAVALRRRSV